LGFFTGPGASAAQVSSEGGDVGVVVLEACYPALQPRACYQKADLQVGTCKGQGKQCQVKEKTGSWAGRQKVFRVKV
jgi:hypothetical protein